MEMKQQESSLPQMSILVDMEEVPLRVSQEEVLHENEHTQQILHSVVCPVCLMLLPMPHYICQECDNTFCPPCLHSWWEKHPDMCIYKCASAKFKTVKRSNTYNALMQMLKKKCEDCEQTIKVGSVMAHDKECLEKVLACGNEGCSANIRRKDFELHSKDCGYAIKSCKFCNALLYRKNMPKHEEEECYEREVGCPYPGCEQKMKAVDVDDHVIECAFVPVICKWCCQSFPSNSFMVHKTVCHEREMTCRWCGDLFRGAECETHKNSCSKLEVECEICEEYIPVSQMASHRSECMMKELIALRKVQKKLLRQNTELKMAVNELQNEFKQLTIKCESGGFEALIKIKEDEIKAAKKDLFRLQNGMGNLQKLRISELTAHQKKPHLSSALCPFCSTIKKKFEEQMAPLSRQKNMINQRIQHLQALLSSIKHSKANAMRESEQEVKAAKSAIVKIQE